MGDLCNIENPPLTINSRSRKFQRGAKKKKKQISNGTVYFPTIIKTSWNPVVEDASQMWAQTTFNPSHGNFLLF